jgi:Calcineurin-like phosphoesterase
MKIFITADPHYREHWFRWLLSQAADYDLVCIAGDQLDMFREEPRMVQAREVSRWIRELAKVTWVAICSGNHDNAGRQVSQDRAPVYDWLVSLGRDPKLITDGVTHVLDDLIVTTVPYHCSKEQKSVWLDRGAIMRRQRGGSLARTPSHSANSVSGVYQRGNGSRRTPWLWTSSSWLGWGPRQSLLTGLRPWTLRTRPDHTRRIRPTIEPRCFARIWRCL